MKIKLKTEYVCVILFAALCFAFLLDYFVMYLIEGC